MKGIMKVSLVVMILVALAFIMCGSVARAEEPDGVNQYIDDKCYQTYNEYQYPSGCRMFYLPRWHEVKFDVHNGKFFLVKYVPAFGKDLQDMEEEANFDTTVYFYTPDGKLFGTRRLRYVDKNRYMSVPHNDRSMCFDRLIIKIQNNTDFNKDLAFKLLDPVDAVRGTPIKGTNFRLLFH